ncbi:MAG: hypothetical protein QF872_06105 [Gammaproteobacteria bacterium]|nr:hypothetical protein [Gammaproteobacteria bacterium]
MSTISQQPTLYSDDLFAIVSFGGGGRRPSVQAMTRPIRPPASHQSYVIR